ncbi:hypothetical protein FB446DRAFT_773831 [Lentinula raphanica]|nr:hypothetical protein FB446DRAFT_773831 [Lentinula raphanica]
MYIYTTLIPIFTLSLSLAANAAPIIQPQSFTDTNPSSPPRGSPFVRRVTPGAAHRHMHTAPFTTDYSSESSSSSSSSESSSHSHPAPQPSDRTRPPPYSNTPIRPPLRIDTSMTSPPPPYTALDLAHHLPSNQSPSTNHSPSTNQSPSTNHSPSTNYSPSETHHSPTDNKHSSPPPYTEDPTPPPHTENSALPHNTKPPSRFQRTVDAMARNPVKTILGAGAVVAVPFAAMFGEIFGHGKKDKAELEADHAGSSGDGGNGGGDGGDSGGVVGGDSSGGSSDSLGGGTSVSGSNGG